MYFPSNFRWFDNSISMSLIINTLWSFNQLVVQLFVYGTHFIGKNLGNIYKKVPSIHTVFLEGFNEIASTFNENFGG